MKIEKYRVMEDPDKVISMSIEDQYESMDDAVKGFTDLLDEMYGGPFSLQDFGEGYMLFMRTDGQQITLEPVIE